MLFRSKKTSDFLNKALHLTVEEGTAKAAIIEGYEVAGKTGTAQKQPRSEGTYLVSFIGHAPAYDPEVVVFIVIDELENTDQTNTSVATQMAGEILAEVLPFLEVYPDESLIESEETEDGSDTQVDGSTDSGVNTDGADNDGIGTDVEGTAPDDDTDGETGDGTNTDEDIVETTEEDSFQVIPESPEVDNTE